MFEFLDLLLHVSKDWACERCGLGLDPSNAFYNYPCLNTKLWTDALEWANQNVPMFLGKDELNVFMPS